MLLTTVPELVSAWPAAVGPGIRSPRGGRGRAGSGPPATAGLTRGPSKKARAAAADRAVRCWPVG